MHIAIQKLGFQLQHKLCNHLMNNLFAQGGKGNHRVQTVAEFGGERPFNRRRILARAPLAAKANRLFRLLGCPRVRGHNQDHIAEIHRAPVMIGQLAVIHHLQQNVVNVWMRLFHFVQQQHAMRMLIHTIRQHPALVKANIARGRANQAGNGVFFHVFRHIEPQKFDGKAGGELLGHFGFAHASWARKQIVADGLFRLAQARAGQFDRRAQRLDSFVLPKHHAFEGFFQIAQGFGIIFGHRFGGDTGDFGNNRLNFLDPNRAATLAFGQQMLGRACLVNHVNGAIGQFAIVDIARGQFHRALNRVIGVFQRVVVFKGRF